MLFETITAIVLAIVYWFFNVRIPGRHKTLPITTIQRASEVTWDFVVIGCGPSGAAAARQLIDSSKSEDTSVLIIERGRCVDGGMTQLPSFTFDLVGSEVDCLLHTRSPFDYRNTSGAVDGDKDIVGTEGETAASKQENQWAKVPYPRGRGVGGTQLLDHSLVFPPVRHHTGLEAKQEAVGESLLKELLTTCSSFAACRSPLSWAFGSSAKEHSRIQPFLPETSDSATRILPRVEAGAVFPHFIWLDRLHNLRPNLARELLDKVCGTSGRQHKKRLGLLLHTGVIGFDFDDHHVGTIKKVSAVLCRESLGSTRRINVRRGVVVCAGNFATCKLLTPIARREWPAPLIDTVSVPLIYQARPGLSDDPVNTQQSLKQIFAWYLARRGGFLNVVGDTSVSIPSSLHPGASLLITLYPCGGFSRQRFAKMGFSPALGVFKEAFHFCIAIHTLPETCLPLSTIAFSTEGGDVLSGNLQLNHLHEHAAEVVRDCLVEGIQFCREIVSLGPLSKLSTQKEALDTTLMPAEDGKKIFKVLYSETKKIAGKIDGAVCARIRERALELASSTEYLRKYVEKHSRYGGFASGAVSGALDEHTLRVKGYSNLFVGDVSSVPPSVAADEGLHAAASVSTAVVCGSVAAQQCIALLS